MCERRIEVTDKRRYLFFAIRSPVPASQNRQNEYIQPINLPEKFGRFFVLTGIQAFGECEHVCNKQRVKWADSGQLQRNLSPGAL